MGHIELSTPVSHIWFLRGVPSRMSILLNISIIKSLISNIKYLSSYNLSIHILLCSVNGISLSEYSIGCSVAESEINNYLSMNRDEIEKLTPEDCAQISYRLAQFGFYLQRSLNRASKV
jgi:DNA-directed RNA polymerase beta' subunit